MNKERNTALLILFLFVYSVSAQLNRIELEKQFNEVTANKKAEVGVAVIVNGESTQAVIGHKTGTSPLNTKQ